MVGTLVLRSCTARLYHTCLASSITDPHALLRPQRPRPTQGHSLPRSNLALHKPPTPPQLLPKFKSPQPTSSLPIAEATTHATSHCKQAPRTGQPVSGGLYETAQQQRRSLPIPQSSHCTYAANSVGLPAESSEAATDLQHDCSRSMGPSLDNVVNLARFCSADGTSAPADLHHQDCSGSRCSREPDGVNMAAHLGEFSDAGHSEWQKGPSPSQANGCMHAHVVMEAPSLPRLRLRPQLSSSQSASTPSGGDSALREVVGELLDASADSLLF